MKSLEKKPNYQLMSRAGLIFFIMGLTLVFRWEEELGEGLSILIVFLSLFVFGGAYIFLGD